MYIKRASLILIIGQAGMGLGPAAGTAQQVTIVAPGIHEEEAVFIQDDGAGGQSDRARHEKNRANFAAATQGQEAASLNFHINGVICIS